jgi:L-rhamnose mutarotase
MKRYASYFRIRPELAEGYRKDHQEIWPELARVIRESGIRNYSLFLRPDGTVFSYFECDDAAAAAAYVQGTEVSARWERAMEKYFIKTSGSAPGPESVDITEVFHQD